MGIAFTVEGTTKVGQVITWTYEDGTAINLGGATLTGTLKDHLSGVVRAIDGSLVIVGDGSAGQFTWAYGDLDVGTPGRYLAQFTATYPDTKVTVSKRVEFYVYEAQEVA